jgi:signal peptidase II
MSSMPPPRLGFYVLAATLILDQASKLWLWLGVDIAAKAPIRVLPFLDLDLVWNRGISYGLFQQRTELGRWMLIVAAIAAAAALVVWLRRSTSRFLAVSLGLIAGGALGSCAVHRAPWIVEGRSPQKCRRTWSISGDAGA